LVDSLTTLIHVISTAAMQAGRTVPGMISPHSLQKAKRLFGAARCIREGGSLTVIATMNTDSGTKADDSVVNDFRGAANMELVLDQALAQAGVYPPFELNRCGTRHAEAILSPEHIEGLKLLRAMLGRMPAENALRELTSMLDKTATNQELLSRIKVWAASMKG
ncbi:MAG: transcription termination factor Rho, partial [Clostridiales bacterium]|nr:transcription termination factor Rho [Clostridiales bacterium]